MLYLQLSTSPFNDYETWMLKSEYDQYLTEFPDRPIPSQNQLEKIVQLAKKDMEKAAKSLVATSEKAKVHAYLQDLTDHRQKLKNANKGRESEPVKDDSGNSYLTKHSCVVVPVSSNKVKKAEGVRNTGHKTQVQVMGLSATAVSVQE